MDPSHIKVLDVEIGLDRESNSFLTRISAKSGNTFCYVPPSSCHSPSTFTKSIPKTVALRVRSITDDKFIDDADIEYRRYLVNRQYDPLVIHNVFNEVMALTKMEAVERQRISRNQQRGNTNHRPHTPSDKETSAIRMIVKYHPNLPNFHHHLRTSWKNHIYPNPTLRRLYPLEIFGTGFMRYQNIKELIASNRYRNDDTNPFKTRNQLSQHDQHLLTKKLTNADILRVLKDDRLIVDGKEYVKDKMNEWKGFECCSSLYKKGVLKVPCTSCKCNPSSTKFLKNIFKNTLRFKDELTGIEIECPRSTCHTKNCIYAIQCTGCSKVYIGKSGEGIGGGRTLQTRTNEHLAKIEKEWRALRRLGFYADHGSNLQNSNEHSAAWRRYTEANRSDFTGELKHFTAMDGSDCLSKVHHPHELYSTFIIDVVHGITHSIKEKKLCKTEKRRQGQLITFRYGLNDQSDFLNTRPFTRDFGHRVTQNLISSERKSIERFHRNSQKLVDLMIWSAERKEEELLADPICKCPETLNTHTMKRSTSRNQTGYSRQELLDECSKHKLRGHSKLKKPELIRKLLEHYNEVHGMNVVLDDTRNDNGILIWMKVME